MGTAALENHDEQSISGNSFTRNARTVMSLYGGHYFVIQGGSATVQPSFSRERVAVLVWEGGSGSCVL